MTHDHPYPKLLTALGNLCRTCNIDITLFMRTGPDHSEARVTERLKALRPVLYDVRKQLADLQDLVEDCVKHQYRRPDPLPVNHMPPGLDTVFKVRAVGQWAATAQLQMLLHNGMGQHADAPTAERDADMFLFWWNAEAEVKYLRNSLPTHLTVEKCPVWKPLPTLRDGINNVIKKIDAL